MVSRELRAEGALPPDEVERRAPRRIGDHYDVLEELGRGGMARVYRVIDARNGRTLALKQLSQQSDAGRMRESELLFESEFHVLAQLAHPRVIAVYDYGIDPDGPYYTMELLDGGDLRERSPLPWREACELIFDVCSSLALLHSRRLVHRDVSPRNVRCTHDGHAKLIDFGAMVPMGANAQVVGTPPFVAPEAVHRSTLDARTDLFSLGNTLYFALTGRLAYPARTFANLIDSWAKKPAPPSAVAPDVPAALDQLVMSLIGLEAALRPRSAFEVMQRLAAVANIQREEPLSVSKAYLVTPTLVARQETLALFRDHLVRAEHGRGRGALIAAPSGLGRSRMLDACALDAKMSGACVLRADATAGVNSDFAVAEALAEQLLSSIPDAAVQAAHETELADVLFEPLAAEPANDTTRKLQRFTRSGGQRNVLQSALIKWILHVSQHRCLVLVVDDADRIDDSSVALLAALSQRARSHSLIVLAAVEEAAAADSSTSLSVLSSRCTTLTLRTLDRADTEQLLGSVFGDVPNLALLSARIHAVAKGNPRAVMNLAQYLVDRDAISYESGSWSLPEELTADDMPASSEAALRERVAALSPLARRLIESQSLSLGEHFTRDDYARLSPEIDVGSLDRALTELVTQQMLTTDGRSYALNDRALTGLLAAELDDATRAGHHRALAQSSAQLEGHALVAARHWLLGGEPDRGIDAILSVLRSVRDRVEFVGSARLSVNEVARVLQLALRAAVASGRRPRDCFDLRYWVAMLSVVTDETLYWDAAPAWRSQLEVDSGLAEYRRRTDIADNGQRLMHALTHAAACHKDTPEAERVYAPDEGMRLLVHYVAISIAVGARTLDIRLLLGLPELLEPFAGLSPALHAIWQNAVATRESSCYGQPERARARWTEVYERLGQVTTGDLALIASIRYAIAFGVGFGEATMGLESATHWAEILDREPLQRVNAMYLRKVVRLQQGDLEGAERCRKQAELLALQSTSRQMFTNMLMLEIGVHAAAWDLTGVQQTAARIEPLAARHPGWLPIKHLAEGHYQRLLGDLTAAEQAYARCLALATPDPSDPGRSIVAWPTAAANYAEVLIALGRTPEARAFAEDALRTCREREMDASSDEIARALALAEAKLGHSEQAVARLDQLIAQQTAMGVTGLTLGATYEARARVAIWTGDQTAVQHFGRLTAQQYRHGRGSPLGARYELLMAEARGAGVLVLPALSPFETTIFGGTDLGLGTGISAAVSVVEAMSGASDRAVRAQRALQLLCDARGASVGHLYLAARSELQLAASSAGTAPDGILQRLVSDFWTQQSDDDDADTAMLSDDAQLSQVWTDLQGRVYRPLLLSASVDGTPLTVGIAVLDAEPLNNAETEIPLVTELVGFLVRTGDSTPRR